MQLRKQKKLVLNIHITRHVAPRRCKTLNNVASPHHTCVNYEKGHLSQRGRLIPFYLTLLLTFLLSELSPSWEAASFAAIQGLPSILRNPKVHYRVHKSPPLVPILSQIDPVHNNSSCLSKIYFNIVPHLTSWSALTFIAVHLVSRGPLVRKLWLNRVACYIEKNCNQQWEVALASQTIRGGSRWFIGSDPISWSTPRGGFRGPVTSLLLPWFSSYIRPLQGITDLFTTQVVNFLSECVLWKRWDMLAHNMSPSFITRKRTCSTSFSSVSRSMCRHGTPTSN
jgi:hypothetical protein